MDEKIFAESSRRAAPLGTSFKQALGTLYRTGRYSLLALVFMTVIRGLLPGLQVAGVAGVVASVSSYPGTLTAGGMHALVVVAIALVGSYVLDNLVKYTSDRLTLKLSYATDLQVVRQLRSLEVQDFESAHTYDKIQRVDSSTGSHIFGLFDSARSAVQAFISITGIAAVIASWNGWIALALLVVPIPAAVATFQLQSKIYDIEFGRAPQTRLANYFRALLTSDATRKEIKIFRLARLFEDRYIQLRKIFLRQDLLLTRFALTKAGTLGLISVFANVGAIVYAALLAGESGRVGELAGFISATAQMNPLVMASFLGVTGIYQHLLYVSNWVAVMETHPAVITEGKSELNKDKASISEHGGVSIEFRNVSFTYPGTERTVLDDVSFTIQPGRTSALVGLNGSGKTTVCKLVLRFYEPTSGTIYVNGTDIKCFNRESLYDCFSALFQDFAKFERSVGSNVTYGAGKDFTSPPDDADVIKSLEMVGLDFLADELPNGLATILGRRFEEGQQLSIGQWQRLATARALYKKPKLLVLDEPTASVDAVSERAMFKALGKINYGLTILLVAHRFTTISHADHIVVLDNGRVVGSGTHDSLLSSCKFYADMFKAQRDYR